jgi:hypothetical protein
MPIFGPTAFAEVPADMDVRIDHAGQDRHVAEVIRNGPCRWSTAAIVSPLISTTAFVSSLPARR